MLMIRTLGALIRIPGDEYAIYLEDKGEKWPNGDPCEALVIQTPEKRYAFAGINSGKLEGYEVVNLLVERIFNHPVDQPLCLDLDELCGNQYSLETICCELRVTDN